MTLLLHILILPWFILGGLFFAYPTIHRLSDQKDQFNWIIKVPLYSWLFIGVICDVIFNATWGTFIFREMPREWLFTQRLKRHKADKRAANWVRWLNLIDPGHV